MTDYMDDFFPGSNRKRDEPPPITPVLDNGWDDKSYLKSIAGKEVEMFTIGALAKALGRPIPTLRMWIQQGYLPNPSFRLKSKEVSGKMIPGRRLYTRSMIEQAIKSFGIRGLLNKPRIEWSRHQDLTIELISTWQQITADLAPKP